MGNRVARVKLLIPYIVCPLSCSDYYLHISLCVCVCVYVHARARTCVYVLETACVCVEAGEITLFGLHVKKRVYVYIYGGGRFVNKCTYFLYMCVCECVCGGRGGYVYIYIYMHMCI